jgi:hypothetical protein
MMDVIEKIWNLEGYWGDPEVAITNACNVAENYKY